MFPDGVYGLACAIINPVCYQRSESDHASLNADQEATIARLRTFSLVCRYCGSIDAIAYTSNGPSNDELGKRCSISFSGNLDNDAKYHDRTTHHHRPSSANPVSEREDEYGAK